MSATISSVIPSSMPNNRGRTVAVCYESHSQDARCTEHDDICPTVTQYFGTGGGNVPMVIEYVGDVASTVSANSCMTATRSEPTVMERTICVMDQGGKNIDIECGICGTLRAETHGHEPIVFAQDFRGEVRIGDIIGAITANSSACAMCVPMIQHHYAVRRLMPVECERLQGFPDGHTDIEWKWKEAPDSARYKALGNSMAVTCMRWIGERIETSVKKARMANDN